MIDLIKLFEKIKWAENGGIADFTEGSYKSGWAFLGDDTPTVQDFNFVQQMNDKKDKWLYNQINEVLKSEGLKATEGELDALLKAIKKMAQGYSTPKEIKGDSVNDIDRTGHTHKIASGNTERKGVVQLTEDLTSESLELGLAAKAGKRLKALLDALTRNLNNYIPNSKKSNAIDSSSSDNVATSLAAKKAYDKAVAAEELASTKYTAQIATTTRRGLTHHYSGYDSDREDLSASAKVIKIIKGFIDSNTRNFGNYIPNSKKSNAVNSPSGDTVATSAAVKTVNDNANGRVNRAGDTMDGALRGKSGGMSTNNPNNIGFVFSGDNDSGMSNPQDGILQLNVNGQPVFEANELSKYTRLRNIADYTMDLQNDGNLVVKKGDSVLWHAFSTLIKSEFYNFRGKFTTDHYGGSQSVSRVYRIPFSANRGLKIYATQLTITGGLNAHRLRLAESLGDFRLGFAVDSGAAKIRYGVSMESDTSVIIHCDVLDGVQGVNVLLIGEYYY